MNERVPRAPAVAWTGLRINCFTHDSEKKEPIVYYYLSSSSRDDASKITENKNIQKLSDLIDPEMKSFITDCCKSDASVTGSKCEELVNRDGNGRNPDTNAAGSGGSKSTADGAKPKATPYFFKVERSFMLKIILVLGLISTCQSILAEEILKQIKSKSTLQVLSTVEIASVIAKKTANLLNENRSFEKTKSSIFPLFYASDRKFMDEYMKEHKIDLMPETRLNGKILEAYVDNKKVVTFEIIDIEKDIFRINNYEAHLADYKTAEAKIKYFERIFKANPVQTRKTSIFIQSAWAAEPYKSGDAAYFDWLFIVHGVANSNYETQMLEKFKGKNGPLGEVGSGAASRVLGAFDRLKKEDHSGKTWNQLKVNCRTNEAQISFSKQTGGAGEESIKFSQFEDRDFVTALTECCASDLEYSDKHRQGYRKGMHCSNFIKSVGDFEVSRKKSSVTKPTTGANPKKVDATR